MHRLIAVSVCIAALVFVGLAQARTSYGWERWHPQKAKPHVKKLLRPPHYRQWLCIHRYEGSWRDPNPPFWGGLQMDMSFMRTYGAGLLYRKGTADHWTPLEQMWAGERAWSAKVRRGLPGFGAWPNTARMCGLL